MMNGFRYLILALIVSAFVSGVSQAEQIILGAATGDQFAGESPSSLYRINPANGDTILVGPIGFNGVTGLALLPDGRLVGSANADTDSKIAVLIEIDMDTGAGSLIGTLGDDNTPGECGRMPDLALNSASGQLYGYADACNGNIEGLFMINPDNADATSIGPSGFNGGGNGLAILPGTSDIFATPIDASGLVTLDPATGAGTVIPASVGNVPNRINAMDFNPETGVLYGSFMDVNNTVGLGAANYLVTISTSDGSTQLVGQTVPGLDAIVFVEGTIPVTSIPTLSEWGLIAMAGLLGVICLLVIRRRKAAA